MKGSVFILYRLRNYEVVTKRTRNDKTDYSANVFNVGIPVSNKSQDELWEEFDKRADEYLKMWNDHINASGEYSSEAYFSGATSQIVPYGVSHNDIYWGCYTNKYSNSYVKNYLKYKKCLKLHKESLIYFTEHVECNFRTSSMTEEEIKELNKGINVSVGLCHKCNCTFVMDEINKGLIWAVKKDLNNKFLR